MPTYRLDLEFEGTRYRGWQEQQNADSVSGALKRAIADAGGELVELGGAGRTDAGVHALQQVAHMRLRAAVDTHRFRSKLNDALPHDVHALAVRDAADRFHARHDALLRSYVYQISRRRTALARRNVWWIGVELDPERIKRVAACLPGMNNFANFCERPQDQTSTMVLVERAEVVCDGALILVRFAASHFLWKMVRRVVGAMARVGAGQLAEDDFKSLVRGGKSNHSTAEWTAPPWGLYLERVIYAGDPPLAPLAAVTPVLDEPTP